jgi:signal transduction histidine kinase
LEESAKILIIDDEEVVVDACRAILDATGYRVQSAGSGEDGLALVDESRPDVVVVDLKMPGMSGFEVLERLRASHPTIVAIVITGYATVSSAVDAMKQGAYDFLPKPFTPEEFRLIIRRAVEKRNLVLETMALRREREVLREHFASIVSHELKSPLGAVQQNVFVLERELAETVPDDQLRRLSRIKSRMSDVLALIDTWRRGVTIDLDAIKERFAPITIDVPIAKAIESVLPQATRKAIDIKTSVAAPTLQTLGDEGTLTQALVNLLGNSVKYSHADSVVTVSASQANGEIQVAVRDEGIGIAEEDLPFIFDTFYRAQSGAEAESGTGLGLAVTRRIVEAHGGTISVNSVVGKGSTFVVTLPVLPADSMNQARREAEAAHSVKEGHG